MHRGDSRRRLSVGDDVAVAGHVRLRSLVLSIGVHVVIVVGFGVFPIAGGGD
jgi:hypothetical protein